MEKNGQERVPGDREDPERDDMEEDGSENDGTGEDIERAWLGDHPELATDESRISVVTGDARGGSVRRTANTGDIVEDAGDGSSGEGADPGLAFDRGSDYMGNEGAVAETEEFGRGSGALSGKLRGEEAIGARSGEAAGPDGAAGGGTTSAQGFDSSLQQEANRRMAETGSALSDAGRADRGDRVGQGRDLGERSQATASQAFGRDIGSSGLPGNRTFAVTGENRDGDAGGTRAAARPSDWSAVLGRLGGSSPGSEENLKLAEIFAGVRFPAAREDVLRCLPAVAEFRVRSASVDVREAIQESSARVFQNTYELIEAVKDEFRRSEKREARAA
jgi:hypothetical protein